MLKNIHTHLVLKLRHLARARIKQRERTTLLLILLLLNLNACTGTQNSLVTDAKHTREQVTEKPETGATASPYSYIDSTHLFANDTASVSMRATLTAGTAVKMIEGYQFQFRSINPAIIFLSSISIVAGGELYFLEQGQIALPKDNSITLKLSLDESLKVATYSQALLQFRFNNESLLLTINLHRLEDFSPP